MADTFVMIFVISIIIPFFSILKLLLPKNSFLTRADDFIRGRFLILLVHLTYFKLVFVTTLNFNSMNPSTEQSGYSSFASVLAMIFVIAVPAFYVVQILVFNRELKNLKKKVEEDANDSIEDIDV